MKPRFSALRGAGLLLMLSTVVAVVIACGTTETVVETVVVEKIVREEVPVLQTVEVPTEKIVEKEVVQTVVIETERIVEVEKEVVQTVEVEKEVVVEREVEVVSGVPRNRTMVTGTRFGGGVNPKIWSPYALGGTHQKGVAFFHEPLFYSDSLNGNSYPWLATGFSYNEDATQLTYTLRDGVIWSDGEEFDSADVAYTFNSLATLGGDVRGGGVFQTFVKEAEVVDDLTVTVHFNFPAPRFHAEVVIYKGDSGTYIVPEHVWKDQNWAEYDAYNNGMGPITTGPWRLSYSDSFRRVLDRVKNCDGWWGCATDFAPLPQVQRYVLYNIDDDTGQAQALITNEIDETHDLRVDTIETILRENPDASTYTGRDPEGEYGMVSWWPIQLHINNSENHLDNADVRWAISKYIDRDRVNAQAYLNKGRPNKWPWPQYAGLKHVNEAMEPLAQEFVLGEYDKEGGDALLTAAGYSKNSDGVWADSSGDTIKCNIIGPAHFTDLGPVMAAVLNQHGIESSWSQPPDVWSRIVPGGDYECSMSGNNGSQSGDIYRTLLLYTGENKWSYDNSDFEAAVALMAEEPDEEKVLELTRNALQIWIKDMPAVPIFEFFNRVARNEHYWTNWPANAPGYTPYMNGIHPHTGFPYILSKLEPTNAE